MHEVAIAEWLLRRAMTKDRAASIVGDLVELRAQRGAGRFWLSVLGVFLSLTWRRPIAFWATMQGFVSFNWFGSVIAGPLHHRASFVWIQWLLAIAFPCSALWMIGLYTSIRYGLRDKVAQLSLAYACLITIFIYSWWQPVVLTVVICMSVVVLLISVSHGEGRRAIMATIVAMVTVSASFVLLFHLLSCYENLLHPQGWGSDEVAQHPSAMWLFRVGWLMIAFLTTKCTSLMHSWLERENQSESEAGRGTA